MGLLDKLRGELIDIIEWVDDSKHTLVWRFPRYQNEIKNGAQLIVRPGQKAIFVHRGEIADVFEEGHYELTSDNLPILGTLLGWKYGFNSPFRSEVYFCSTRQITDLKWGTPNPVMLRDPEFGPIRLRAFGTYTLKAVDPKATDPKKPVEPAPRRDAIQASGCLVSALSAMPSPRRLSMHHRTPKL